MTVGLRTFRSTILLTFSFQNLDLCNVCVFHCFSLRHLINIVLPVVPTVGTDGSSPEPPSMPPDA